VSSAKRAANAASTSPLSPVVRVFFAAMTLWTQARLLLGALGVEAVPCFAGALRLLAAEVRCIEIVFPGDAQVNNA
jgi:hypothetical protein